MRAAVLAADGPALVDRDPPQPGPTEVAVRVAAAALNRADLLIAAGRRHGAQGGLGTPLGLEWCGTVIDAGASVTTLRHGDRVMGSGGGGFAEIAVADERRCFALAGTALDDQQAAGLTIALRTAYVALVVTGALRRGQSVMVLGASSSTGLMTMQVARVLGAGLVIGSSTQALRRSRLADFGAHHAVDTTDAHWAEQVLQLTGGRGVDLLVDHLAGPLLNDAMRATAVGGCIVNVGRMAGETAAFDCDLHSLRRIRYQGTTFRTRSADEVGAIGRDLRTALWPALAAGRLRLPIDSRWPLERVAEAYAHMRANRHFGKILVLPPAAG
ncbi:MAG: zinc-binding dehydrogenase [Rubrivivax sp.]